MLWPGAIRNRLYDVAASEKVLLPFIPCSFDGVWENFGEYNSCVMEALEIYKDAGHITSQERNRLRDSARRAFEETQ